MASRRRFPTALALCAVVAALAVGLIAAPAQAAVKHVDGVVKSKNATAKTFRITTESGRTMSFKVTATTEFERVSFAGLTKGKAIEVDYVTIPSGNVARQVETQGGGGGDDDSGGDDDGSHGGGHDDGPNHT